MLKSIRAKEVKTSIKELYELWKVSGDDGERDQRVLVDLKKWFGDLTHNFAIQMVGGKRYFGRNSDYDEVEARKCKRVMRRFFNLMGVFVMSDALPFLGCLDLKGLEKKMKMAAKELDTIITGWLEEHKQRRTLGGSGEANDEQDFMYVILNILQDANISDFDADTINKATCLNMILAGSDTTMVSLTWVISLPLNNPHVLKKVWRNWKSILEKIVKWRNPMSKTYFTSKL